MIQEGAYETLLSKASELLLADPQHSCALAYRGRALACLSRYEEASAALLQAMRVQVCPQFLSSLQELEKYCRRICAATQAYEHFSRQVAALPSTWYAEKLLDPATREVVSLSTGYEELDEQLKELGRDASSVFILGDQRKIEAFRGVDTGVYYKLRDKLPPYPLTQASYEGYVYLKTQTYNMNWRAMVENEYGNEDRLGDTPEPVFMFPTVDWTFRGSFKQPNPHCDVFYSMDAVDSTAHRLLRWTLDRLAVQRQDFFVPQYQNIIDPNLTALLDTPTNLHRWTATDFLIEEVQLPKQTTVLTLQGCVRKAIGRSLPWHSVELILSFAGDVLALGRAHLGSPLPSLPLQENRELGVAIESILTAALPLVAKLRKPALLLPGKLQAVVKAQRIYLNPGEEYTGVWHYDGLSEEIVAVVLYYYRYSVELEGGDLEFISRQPRDSEFWIGGDCSPDAMSRKEVTSLLEELPRCRVPMKQGTLVVFSNYQLVHRVLRMVNHSATVASRDFLVLFLVDQRSPLLSTLALPQLVDKQASESLRKYLFLNQLKPAGKFGLSSDLAYSTGNGSCALLGWMENNDKDAELWDDCGLDRSGVKSLEIMSRPPPLHRGLSWVLDPELWEEKLKEV